MLNLAERRKKRWVKIEKKIGAAGSFCMDQSSFRFLFRLTRKSKQSGLSKSEKSLAKRNVTKLTQDLSLICICQTDKALPVKTSKPNFLTFFLYFGNSLFDYLWDFFVCCGNKPKSHFALKLSKFGVARSEELEVNQLIVQDIPRLSSQSERAKNTIHCLSIY